MPIRIYRAFHPGRSLALTVVGLGIIALPFVSRSASCLSPQQAEKPSPQDAELQRLRNAYGEARSKNDVANMEASAQRILEIAQASQDINLLGRYHHNMGLALLAHGDAIGQEKPAAKPFYLRAIQEFEQALALSPRVTEDHLQDAIDIQSNMNNADALLKLKNYDSAIVLYERSVVAATKAKDVKNLPAILKNLGTITMEKKTTLKKEEIADFFLKRRSLFQEGKMYECTAWCDYYLAATHDPLDAIQILKPAIAQADTFDPDKKSEFRASALTYLGLLYLDTENFEEAYEVSKEADAVWQKCFADNPQKRAEAQAESRNNSALALLRLGEFKAAVQEFDRALSLKTLYPGFEEWSTIETNKRLAQQADITEDTALSPEMLRQPGDILVRTAIGLRLGESLRATGRAGEALHIFQETRSLLEQDMAARPAPSPGSTGLKRMFLGAVTLECGMPREADIILEQSRQELERAKNRNVLTFCLPLLACAQERAGLTKEADTTFQQAVTRFEARLAHISAPERMGLFQFVQATTLYADYANFLARTRRMEEALVMADRARARGMARQALDVLAASNVSESERKTKERLWMDPLTPQELQTLVRTYPDTLFLHYNLGRDGLTLFAYGAKTPVRSFPLGNTYPALMHELNSWLQNLTLGGLESEEERLARGLGKVLLLPLYTSHLLSPTGQGQRMQRLVIVPDGGLHGLPFAALILPEPGAHRLIERDPYSITLSLRQLVRHFPQRKAKAEMLVVSDPTGDHKGPENKEAALQGSAFDPPLRADRMAAEQIRKMFPRNVKTLIGNQADKTTVIHLLPDYSLLVFATHGHPREERNGLASYLTLAPEQGAKTNGVLEASQLLNTPLSARLTVLMACETAQGRLSGGEGNQGLVWAFGAAGCPSIIASLWKVNSDSASRLLPLFLQEQQKLPKDVALQKAILKVRAQYPQPGNWAAFQVYGDAN